MENRGQKRVEVVDELPADKRACNSVEFRPSTSNSSAQTQICGASSTHETHDADMDTSSSASPSSRSEGEHEKDSAYGSCDSDDAEPRHRILREYQRRRSSGDHGKLKSLLSSLSEETDPSAQLIALTELCEVLSFCTEDSLSSLMADMLSPLLVKLAKHESNVDIMLLSIRAITYLCDVFPRSSGFLVRHDAVPALCQRLMAIDYLDVAEQCLQALEKISRDQPLACLNAGAVMAVLSFIDFFSTSVQRVAVSTVVNICRKLPSESPSPFMEAVPILCNLLQYEDRQLVESVAICLTKIAEQVSHSAALLDELCRHGLIHQSTHLLNLNSRTTLAQPVYNGLIGMLTRLSSGSIVAFRTLYELNVSSILKEILSTNEITHTMSTPHLMDGCSNQALKVLKLINGLLPTSLGEKDIQLAQDKESFLVNHPELLQKFGLDILPVLIQVVNSGANTYVCYGCLSAIYNLICLSRSDAVVELLKGSNLSSVLAGIFSRKDQHVLVVSLQIAEMILQKHSDAFLYSFIKEGVFFAIDTLLETEKNQQSTSLASDGSQLTADLSHKPFTRETLRCLCLTFESTLPCSPPTCRIEKDSVHTLAKHIKTSFFGPEVFDSEKGFTDILQNLKSLSSALSELVAMPLDHDACGLRDDKFCSILHQVMEKLNGRESVSTFEFIESGVVRSLLHYLSNGLYLRDSIKGHGSSSHLSVVGKRFEVFASLLWSSSDIMHDKLTLAVLIKKLQNALSSLENFPVIVSQFLRQRNSFATVPNGRCTMYPCLRVRFLKEEGDTCIRAYSQDFVTVDPFCSLAAIEGYLWPKVNAEKTESVGTSAQAMECQSPPLPSTANPSQGECLGRMETDRVSPDLPGIQEDDLSDSGTRCAINGSEVQEQNYPSGSKVIWRTQQSAIDREEDTSPRLLFYIEGNELDQSLTLYQAILQQKLRSEDETIIGTKLWNQIYTLTYKRAIRLGDPQECPRSAQFECDEVGACGEYAPFLSDMFACKLASCLDKSNPTYDTLFLLKSLEVMNRFLFHLTSLERLHAFAEGRVDNLDNLRVLACPVPQTEFMSSKLTEKLEQQMRDSVAVSTGGLPSWCNQLMASCPFLFSFEAKSKYFRLAAFGHQQLHHHPQSHNTSAGHGEGRPITGSLPRKKFLASRDQILQSAARMMEMHAHQKVLVEVEYIEEVGTGLGPTLEFYTLVSHEFQKQGLGMWREDHRYLIGKTNEDTEILMSPSGLFPRPWSATSNMPDETFMSEVVHKFVLLGKVVAKALQDGRVLDLPFSKAFYRLILGQELGLYDIHSFDPELCKSLLELQALVHRKKFLESTAAGDGSTSKLDLCFRGTRVEDLCLEFTLPGYPDYVLASGSDNNMVDMSNLEEYIKLVVEATVHNGIHKQVEAFRSGFNQIFSIEHLRVFNEDELDRLLCGERDFWNFNEVLDHIKFDHGYTASSLPVLNLLEILQEFDYEQRRAFLQFVTGAPRLPPGGLASLNPKLTIVRKHCSNSVDADLPSVMTCANYLKLPPYSSKEKTKEKLVYAITEGQGSFHLS